MTMLAPGAVIGILGGGQLGRMLALKGAALGFKIHIYAPEKDSCAFDVCSEKTCAAYDDMASLAKFADACDVVTYEFENVPASTAEFLSSRKPLHPSPQALAVAQDRFSEKKIHSVAVVAAREFCDCGFNRRFQKRHK